MISQCLNDGARRIDWLLLRNRFSAAFEGLGGTEVVRARCTPGVCFRDTVCSETADGIECGPCPDGYTGDGFSCDDVDEVGGWACVGGCGCGWGCEIGRAHV